MTVLLLLIFGGCVSPALAFDGVIGFIGASYSNGQRPQGAVINGARYLDLPTALSKISDYWVANAAVAGAASYSRTVNTETWPGYLDQAWSLANMTSIDGQSTLKVLVIDVVGECAAGAYCGETQTADLINRLTEVIDLAQYFGIKVIVLGYPSIPAADPVFNSKFKAVFQHYPGVSFIEPYGGIETMDGVHPNTPSMKIAALRLKELLIDLGFN